MDDNKQKAAGLVERMKQILQNQRRDIGVETEAKLQVLTCPNCGAGRAKSDGLTRCAYCNFEFLAQEISKGIHLKKTDNSR